MSLIEPSAETIIKRRRTRVRSLDAEFHRLLVDRDEADQRVVVATTSGPMTILRQAQIDKAWLDREVSAAAAALEEAVDLLRQAEQAERCEREDRWS